MKVLYLGVVALLGATGCARVEGSGDAATGSPASRAAKAATIANAITANPGAADSILRASGYARASFQKLMYDIATDSAMSAAYAAAKSR